MSTGASSVSQEIIFGSIQGVMRLIQDGADINEKDIYGFTPLIEATLKEDIEIAKLLLAHGAKVDQQDISGQTALQWAVNKSALDFCHLYLNAHANPNHYSADGQPLLVNPILREQKELLQLLGSEGADSKFAYDFIHAKLIGHRYELIGKVPILNTQGNFIDLNYEGFFLEFTVGIIYKTLVYFMNSEAGMLFRSYRTVLSKIARTLRFASEIIPYKYMGKLTAESEDSIRRTLNEDLVVIPVSYEGHAITFIKYKNLFAKCDRGVKAIVDTVVIYQVGNSYALNADFLKDLMYNNKTDHYIHTDIKNILNLKPLATLPARYQLSGNCSWANVEASVPAMMFMLMLRGNGENRGEVAALSKSIMNFYDTWVEWDKDRMLMESIQAFHAANRKKRAAIASSLAAILFQRCKLSHKKQVERAKKILAVLALPEYSYILKSYIKVYYTKMAGPVGKNFIELLKHCGFEFSRFTELKNHR